MNTKRLNTGICVLSGLLLAVSLAGCPKAQSHHETEVMDGGSANADDDGGDDGHPRVDPDGGPVPNCKPKQVTKADLLFVVDNSGSMREEQEALKKQFPRLIQALTSGERFPGDPNPFPPVHDLHVGVVDTDMGLVGITGINGCSTFGDDGIMLDPTARGCKGGTKGERFLSYDAGGGVKPEEIAANVGCLTNVGTDGCGFEQQLEAPLKALWPKVDIDYATGRTVKPNRIQFLSDAFGDGKTGHGDQENQGFFRRGDDAVLGIVMVTDEEDCSSSNTQHFTPMQFLEPSSPLYNQDLNLRCFYNKQDLYPIERYVTGFKALHPENENLVVFTAIVGVPPDLVDEKARAGVDFSNETQRNAYYDALLADKRMTERPDPAREPGNGNLIPSCETPNGVAYPPRRIVELAKDMGENGLVQSICQDDFAPALDAFLDRLSSRLTDNCSVN